MNEPKDLRDEFAIAALIGIVASWEEQNSGCTVIARRAYEYADAMLAARKTEQ